MKRTLSLNLVNMLGWKTGRKIVVIESDDWGSIRMPSREVYEKCLKNGYPVDKNPYEKYDSLESEDDLTALYDTLSKVKDKNGAPAVITANSLVANPDFDKMAASGYTEYHYELVTETFKKYPEHANSFSLWKEGQDKGVFSLQFHGREHFNVSLFLDAMKNNVEEARFAAENNMPGAINKVKGGNRYVEAMRYSDNADKESKRNILVEGLDIFKSLHGFGSDSFIATNYIWSPDFNESLLSKGVKYFQGNMYQLEPIEGGTRFKKHFHYTGQKNKLGQYYFVRNSVFEPSLLPGIDSVAACLQQISLAFRWKTPAIISSHRLNYIGFINEENRKKNLLLLEKLLHEIVKKWPDVEFISSSELGRLISGNKN